MGSIGQNLTFSAHGPVAYQIKWNHKMQQHGSKYFARRPPFPPWPRPQGDGVKWSKFNFFRTWSCCISNYRESRMQQHGSKYFARRPWGSKGQNSTFQNIIMLHIKLKEITNAARWSQIFCLQTAPTPTLGLG